MIKIKNRALNMMKRYKIINLTLLFFCLLIINSCYTISGHLASSENIEESKKNGVFICALAINQNPYKINDTISVHFKEIWIENIWGYSGTFRLKAQKRENAGFQICINFESPLKGYNNVWVIGNDSYTYFGEVADNTLGIELKEIPNTALHYKIFQGSFEFDSIGKQIGEIILKKIVY